MTCLFDLTVRGKWCEILKTDVSTVTKQHCIKLLNLLKISFIFYRANGKFLRNRRGHKDHEEHRNRKDAVESEWCVYVERECDFVTLWSAAVLT